MTVDEATAAMRELEAAVPGIDARLHVLRNDDLAELLNDLGSVRAGIAAIRRALPDADASRIVLARTQWLFEDADLDSIAPAWRISAKRARSSTSTGWSPTTPRFGHPQRLHHRRSARATSQGSATSTSGRTRRDGWRTNRTVW